VVRLTSPSQLVESLPYPQDTKIRNLPSKEDNPLKKKEKVQLPLEIWPLDWIKDLSKISLKSKEMLLINQLIKSRRKERILRKDYKKRSVMRLKKK